MKNLVKIFSLFVLLIASMSAFAEPVNVNTASAAEIAKNLKGIGMKKAQAIIAYRTKHGAFKSADELANVKGIGSKTVVAIRGDVLVNNTKQSSASHSKVKKTK